MKDCTDITVLLDRSGSMAAIAAAVCDGVNKFVEEQQKTPGEGVWSFAQFDDHSEAKIHSEEFPHFIIEARPQDCVPKLTTETFKPRGSTALRDAIVATIDRVGKRLAQLPEAERPDKVAIVIMTDGVENASKVVSPAQLKETVDHQREKYNWKFIYLGANQDSFAVGGAMGVNKLSTRNYDANREGVMKSLSSVSSGIRSWKADGNPDAEIFLTTTDPDPGSPADLAAKVDVSVSVTRTEPANV